MQTLNRIFLSATALLIMSATPALAQSASPATGAPTLKVITPQEGQTLYGTKVPILVAVENIQLTDNQTNLYAVPGQGHVNLWLDDQNPTKDSAVKVADDNFTFSDVSAGDHTLKAELVANDNSSLTPPVVQTIKFKTQPLSAPSPAATSGFDKNTALVILFVVALIIISAWWYTKEDDEEEKVEPKKSTSSNTKKTTAKKKKTAGKSRRK